MKKLVGLFTVVLFSLGLSASAGELQLTKGTMQIGGDVTFDIDYVSPEEGDSVTGYMMNVNPSFGFFFLDRLEVMAMVGFGIGFGDMYEKASKNISFGLGGRYFLDFGSKFHPYMGVGVGPSFVIPDEGDTLKYLGIEIPIGVMYELSSSVALSLGTKLNISFGLTEGAKDKTLNVPIGYLGMEAFF